MCGPTSGPMCGPTSWPRRRRGARARGFTLLEVMVAIAILGLSLTVILSAQAGAFSSAAYARNVSVATGLGRCKMAELELKLKQDGFPAGDELSSGPCCDADEQSAFLCEWRIEVPTLPEPPLGELDLDTDLGGPGFGPLGAVAGGQLDGASSPSDLAGALSGASADPSMLGGLAGQGASGMMGMVMSLVYPNIKTLFESSTRRVTVRVAWREGTVDYSFELVQWIAVPQIDPNLAALNAAAAGGLPGAPGAGGLPGGMPGLPGGGGLLGGGAKTPTGGGR